MCPCQIYSLNIRLKVNIKYEYNSVSLTSSPSPGTPVNVWPAQQSRRAEDLLSIRTSGVSKSFQLMNLAPPRKFCLFFSHYHLF